MAILSCRVAVAGGLLEWGSASGWSRVCGVKSSSYKDVVPLELRQAELELPDYTRSTMPPNVIFVTSVPQAMATNMVSGKVSTRAA